MKVYLVEGTDGVRLTLGGEAYCYDLELNLSTNAEFELAAACVRNGRADGEVVQSVFEACAALKISSVDGPLPHAHALRRPAKPQ